MSCLTKLVCKLPSMLIKVLCVAITEFINAVNAAAGSLDIVITCRLVFNHLGYQASQGIPELLGSLHCEGNVERFRGFIVRGRGSVGFDHRLRVCD